MDNKIDIKTDAEISEEFLKEYRELCIKYKRDFTWSVPEPKIIKLEINANPTGVLPNAKDKSMPPEAERTV